MRTEIHILAWSIALGFAHIVVAIIAATKQKGRAWNMSNREGDAVPLTGAACRLDQASSNFKETFPFFAAAVLALAFLQKGNFSTEIGAHLYFWARLAYLPIFAAGIVGLRSLVWTVSMVGLALVWAGIYLA